MKKAKIILLLASILLVNHVGVFACDKNEAFGSSLVDKLVMTNEYDVLSKVDEEYCTDYVPKGTEGEHVSIHVEDRNSDFKRYIITEGEITNKHVLKNNGKVYLDGNLVEVNEDNVYEVVSW